jgi:glycosyltransferase involved in cell wall biosynthesis
MNKKVSVIMASFLGDYPNAAKNRDKKFVRAVKSFINQTYQNTELIIVSDGCTKTYEIYKENWDEIENIQCFILPKQPLYGGEVRTEGLKNVTGEIVAYLDNDDMWGKTHLETIVSQFDIDNYDWVYYDDYLVGSKDFKTLHKRLVEPRFGQIGTSSICHKNIPDIKWDTGYGHDWMFVLTLASKGLRFKKLKNIPQYLVCHWGDINNGGGDF